MVVGEGRVEVVALAVDALVHGAPKGLERPRADAGLRVGRDVGGVDGAERRRQGEAAGIGLAARRGVADGAIPDRRQHLSLLHEIRREAPPAALPDRLPDDATQGDEPGGPDDDNDQAGDQNPLHLSTLFL